MNELTEFAQYRNRRSRRVRDRRVLNNLPLAHRLACSRAIDERHSEYLLGQAMVGLVQAAELFEPETDGLRFGAYAEPHITEALDRIPSGEEVELAQAEVAGAISSQDRVQTLAAFLDVPVAALVGGLMDVTARERVANSLQPVGQRN